MIPIKNVFYMLAYAFRALDRKAYRPLSGRRREGTHAVLPHHPPYGSVVGGYLWLH